jgi:hypothetical protein
MLSEGVGYSEIQQKARYRTKSGELKHVSIGKISEINKHLSKKEGGISD